jgi:hypothetical protein
MLHRLIARHEDVAWLSTFNEVFPTFTWLSAFSDLYRLPWLGTRIRHLPFFPKPFEAYRFWEHFLRGFSRRDKPLTKQDVPEEGIDKVRQIVEEILEYQGKTRFLIKVTGWSRIEYFDRIFPDTRFVFLKREHRSVVSSWVKAGWLDVTTGLDDESWQWSDVSPAYYQLWRELGGGPLLSAAVKIQMDLDDIEHNIAKFPERSYELRFEDLITKPEQTLRPLLAFCDLEWTPEFERVIHNKTFYDPTDKWRKHLSDEEGQLILEFFERANRQRGTVIYS